MLCLRAAVLFRSGRLTACSGWPVWKWVDVAWPASRPRLRERDNKREWLASIGPSQNRENRCPDPIRVSLVAAAYREDTPGPDPGHAEEPGGRAEDPLLRANYSYQSHTPSPRRIIPGPFQRESKSRLAPTRRFDPAAARRLHRLPGLPPTKDRPRPTKPLPACPAS